MDAVNVAEARKNFSDLMLRVAYGKERIIIERHGKPLVALVSIEDLAFLQVQDQTSEEGRAEALSALEEARQFRQRLLAARGGRPLPNSADMIAELREERLNELSHRD